MLTKAILLAALSAAAYANSVPIFGTYPGWIQGGGQAGIEIEIFFDYLCADSKANYPIVKEMLGTQMDNGMTVFDAVTLKLSSFPLDYHVHSWQVAQLLPYFLDEAIEGVDDLNEYLDYGFAQQDTVLGLTGMSQD